MHRRRGDEVLLPTELSCIRDACTAHRAGKRFIIVCGGQGFFADIANFRSQITEKRSGGRHLAFKSTGKILTPDDSAARSQARSRTGIWLISDEIYSDLYLTGERPHSASQYYDKTIIVSGLSKSLSMTGWRLGWAACKDAEIMNAIQVLHGFTTVCAATIVQKASLLAWTDEAEAPKARA